MSDLTPEFVENRIRANQQRSGVETARSAEAMARYAAESEI